MTGWCGMVWINGQRKVRCLNTQGRISEASGGVNQTTCECFTGETRGVTHEQLLLIAHHMMQSRRRHQSFPGSAVRVKALFFAIAVD